MSAMIGNRFRVASVLLLLLATSLAGCARNAGTDDAASGPGPGIVVATALPFGSLDPADATGGARVLVLPNVLEGLTRLDPASGEPSPALATRWSVTDDGLAWTFELREGVTFHDGAPFDAAAAKLSLDRARGDIAGRRGEAAAPLAGIREVRVGGPRLLTVELAEPDSAFPATLALPVASMVSPRAYSAREFRSGADGAVPVGTGPFRAASVAAGSVRLEANPEHWGAGAGASSVAVVVHGSPESAAAAASSGAAHLAFGGLDAAAVRGLDDASSGVALEWPRDAAARVLVLDATGGPFAEAASRRGVAHAVDRAAIVAGGLGVAAAPLASLAPANVPGGGTTEFTERYGNSSDVAAARGELAAAGFSRDDPLDVTLAYDPAASPGELDAATRLKEMLEATGALRVTLEAHSGGAFTSGVELGLFEAFLYRATTSVPDAHAYHRAHYGSAGAVALGGYYASPVMDDLVAAEARAAPEARASRAADVRAFAAEDVPLVPLWQEGVPLARAANLTGAAVLADGSLHLAAARLPAPAS